jgi:hypothetical protein
VQAVGAIQNRTRFATAFRFQIVILSASGQHIGLRTVTTPVIQPGRVHEIFERVPVTASAHARAVDLRNVELVGTSTTR